MRDRRVLSVLSYGALFAAAVAGTAFSQDVRREYAPGREDVIPHVSGDAKFSATYEDWKDEDAIHRAKAKGLMSHEMNFKDFRWLEKSFDGELALDEGKALFHAKDGQGRSCAGCHGENGEKLVGAHAKFPKFSERAGRVVVVPTQIKMCAESRMDRTDLHEETRANTMLAFYVGALSDGHVIDIDVTSPGPLRESFERGKELYFRRVGNFHFACANCHTPPTAGSYLRGQRPTTFFGDASEYPIYHYPYALPGEDRGYVFTLQHQIKSCQLLSRMYPGKEGSKSMTDIEVFLTAASNGYKVSIPVSEYNMSTDYLQPNR